MESSARVIFTGFTVKYGFIMDAEWYLKRARETVAWMRDELSRTNDPEEMRLWEQGIETGTALIQMLEKIIGMSV
jgi:hypothetical protein